MSYFQDSFHISSTQQELSLVSSYALINNLVPGIALAKEMGLTMDKFIQWNVDKYYNHGYHDVWIQNHGVANLKAYTEGFINGRKLVSKRYTIQEKEDEIIVESKVWYLAEPVEALFFYDIELEELCVFVAGLATSHAKLCGIDLCIKYVRGVEIASLRSRINI